MKKEGKYRKRYGVLCFHIRMRLKSNSGESVVKMADSSILVDGDS